MFGKLKELKFNNSNKNQTQELDINIMPNDFYGGKNPVVEFKEETKEVNLNKYKKAKLNAPTTAEKKDFDKQKIQHLKQPTHPANLLTNPKFLLLLAGIIFVLAIIVGGIYFWLTSRSSSDAIDNVNSNMTPTISTSTTSTTNDNTSNTTTTNTTTSVSNDTDVNFISVDIIDFPSILLGYGQDYDNDKLFDMEESLLGSDPSIIDSDSDGHLDGHEVYHLYNPISVEPNRLIDAGKVVKYINPTYNYKIYYPKDWTYGNIDSNNRDVLFTALNGESVEIKLFDLDASQTFDQWFALYAPKEYSNNLNDFESVFKQKGKVRNDKLVYYFVDNNQVYIMVYRASNNNQVNYRQIMEMMARSFRTGSNTYVKQWATGVVNSLNTSTVQTTSSAFNITTTITGL